MKICTVDAVSWFGATLLWILTKLMNVENYEFWMQKRTVKFWSIWEAVRLSAASFFSSTIIPKHSGRAITAHLDRNTISYTIRACKHTSRQTVKQKPANIQKGALDCPSESLQIYSCKLLKQVRRKLAWESSGCAGEQKGAHIRLLIFKLVKNVLRVLFLLDELFVQCMFGPVSIKLPHPFPILRARCKEMSIPKVAQDFCPEQYKTWDFWNMRRTRESHLWTADVDWKQLHMYLCSFPPHRRGQVVFLQLVYTTKVARQTNN